MTSSNTGKGVAPTLSAQQLLAAVPGLADTGIDVNVIDYRTKPGASLTLADITALAADIHHQVPPGEGVVVTQGTDTIEETSYLMDLLHRGRNPVVVTGAMRNPTLAGADGPANIVAAIRTAAHPDTCGQGCVVVFNDEIHAARRVRKTHTSSPAAFTSPDGGPLGYLTEGRVCLFNRLAFRTTVPGASPQRPSRVGVLMATLGDDDTAVRALAPHIDGLVIAGFGAGHVPDNLVPALEECAGKIPVVLASRAGAGPVLKATYGFAGSEQDLLARGMIRAGYLDALKSRILLHTLLAAGADRETIAAAFAVAGGYEHPMNWPWPLDHKDS